MRRRLRLHVLGDACPRIVSEPAHHKTVLILVEAYEVTGIAKQLLEFVAEARTRQAPWTPHVVTFSRRPRLSSASPFERALADLRLAHTPIDERFRFDPGVVAQLVSLARKLNADIIETHHVKSHAVVMLARRALRIPWAAFHHGYTAANLTVRGYNLIDHLSLRGADFAFAVSSSGRAQLRSRGISERRIAVIPNGIAPQQPVGAAERSRARQDLGVGDAATMVLAMGRLSREKGFADLVHTAHVVRASPQAAPVHFIVAGDGPERDKLNAQIRANNLADTIRLVGHRRDVRPLYAASDVLMLPSHSESAPNVILEAMAYGLPVVATDVGGVSEIVVRDVTGLLVPARDPPAAARALCALVHNTSTARAMGTAGRERALTHFSVSARAARVIRLYDSLGMRSVS